MPIQYGESVVMRLLDQTRGTYELHELGMPARMVSQYKSAVSRPHGMVLATGPTGSGKTTTLYAALKLLNSPGTKIITVEDPVEYRMPRINQVQINSGIGLTFAKVLRSALRQDPDIVLVGEIRDEETAEIALRAAMTGHLVMSTLHTNDAISTVNRLIDMGIKPYLLATALNAVLAQRLIRRICEGCAQDAVLTGGMAGYIKDISGADAVNVIYKKGRGCARCNFTGYQGRIGVYEFLHFDQNLKNVLAGGVSSEFTSAALKREDFHTLEQFALQLARQGITTLDEVVRISADLDMDVEIETIGSEVPDGNAERVEGRG